MPARSEPVDLPEDFRRAVATLRSVPLRSEVAVSESAAPHRLAPYAVALTAEVLDAEEEVAAGRLIVLHDPAGQESWEGDTRLVAYGRAGVDAEIAADPLLPEVGWSWLLEALAGREATYAAAGGTVTTVASTRFGVLAGDEPACEVELRASWSPRTADLGRHLAAWCDVLCAAAGLPPVPPGVLALPARRRRG